MAQRFTSTHPILPKAMVFRPRQVDTEVNLPQTHPLADLVWLGGGLALITVVIFFSSGFLVDYLVRFVPSTVDNDIADQVDVSITDSLGPTINEGAVYDAAQELFSDLRLLLPKDDERNYRLILIDDATVNAMAAPGGIIYVYRGLLNQVESENELAMVLAHEYGHIYHKHHWKRLGRGVLLSVIMAIASGNQSSFQAELATAPATALIAGHSRASESESDRFALQVICEHYGHIGGAQDFFARLAGSEANASAKLGSFFRTHPMSEARVEDIKNWAQALDCMEGDLTPFTDTSSTDAWPKPPTSNTASETDTDG